MRTLQTTRIFYIIIIENSGEIVEFPLEQSSIAGFPSPKKEDDVEGCSGMEMNDQRVEVVNDQITCSFLVNNSVCRNF